MNTNVSLPKSEPGRETHVFATLPEHCIEYVGLSRKSAILAKRIAFDAGRVAVVHRTRVSGSDKRSRLFHYTVVSYAK